jgi:hypothetical protein
MSKHEIYSRDATVYLVSGKDKFDALHRAIEQSGFVANLLARWSASGKSKQDFLIVIKPNIMTASLHQEDSPVYTEPALAEDLIHIMREQGFANFAVVEAENVYNYSYTGRRVHKVAELCSYTGNGYRIASMTEEKQERKTRFCHSERAFFASEESPCRKEIPRFARNDKQRGE